MSTTTVRPFAAVKLLTFSALAFAGCHVAGIKGNGHITTETRIVEEFTSVEADGSMSVIWSNGSPGFKVTTDQNLISRIETSMEGKKLRIHSRGQLRPSDGTKIVLSSSSLGGVRLRGAVRFDATSLSGKGFYLEAMGATRVTIAGAVTELMATMSGASRLEAESLQTDSAELSIAGAGKANVSARKVLKVSISGAGKVTYSGNPTVEKHIAGAGSISQRD